MNRLAPKPLSFQVTHLLMIKIDGIDHGGARGGLGAVKFLGVTNS